MTEKASALKSTRSDRVIQGTGKQRKSFAAHKLFKAISKISGCEDIRTIFRTCSASCEGNLRVLPDLNFKSLTSNEILLLTVGMTRNRINAILKNIDSAIISRLDQKIILNLFKLSNPKYFYIFPSFKILSIEVEQYIFFFGKFNLFKEFGVILLEAHKNIEEP